MQLDSRIPAKVKVGGLTFIVEADEALIHESSYQGTKSTTTGRIRLSPQLPPNLQCSTFLHELIHALADEMHLGLKEETVQRLEFGLFQVLADNNLFFGAREQG